MKEAERNVVEAVARPAPRADVGDEAELMGKLEPALPASALRQLMGKVEDMTDPRERMSYLVRVAKVVDTYTRIVQEADRIII